MFKISRSVRFQKNARYKQIDYIYSLKSPFFYGIFVFLYSIQHKNFDVHLPEVGACAVYGQITGGYRGTKISASKPCLYSLIFVWVALVVILSVPHGSLLVPLQKNKKDYMRILESSVDLVII